MTPTNRFTLLGLVWDTALDSAELPEEKVLRFRADAQSLLSCEQVSCRDVQQFLGHINFAACAVPQAHLFSRDLQSCQSMVCKLPPHIFRRCPLSSAACKELLCWLNLSLFSKPQVLPIPTKSISTDVSRCGWGKMWGNPQLSGSWQAECRWHINVQEPLAPGSVLSSPVGSPPTGLQCQSTWMIGRRSHT